MSRPIRASAVVCTLDESLTYVPASTVGPTNNPEFKNKTLTFRPLDTLAEGRIGTTTWRFKLRGLKPGLASFRTEVTCDQIGGMAATKEEMVRVVK